MVLFRTRATGCGSASLLVKLFLLLIPHLLAQQQDDPDRGFDPLQAYPNMPVDYRPEAFASDQTNHMQYYQDADANEWKWETTQNLQRQYMMELFNISSMIYAQPGGVKGYEDLREHLDVHCNRVYNGTCEWQFSPPFNPAQRGEGVGATQQVGGATGAIVYVCCADAQELQDLLWSLKFLDLNFNDEFKYPVLIFHENLGFAQENLIRANTRSTVTLHRVAWRLPAFIDHNYVPRWYKGYSLGFRHMIRFVAMEMYQHPALASFDYYWRLDSDSFLISRVYVGISVSLCQSLYGLSASPSLFVCGSPFQCLVESCGLQRCQHLA
jgi:hypothetical protein